MPADFYIIGAMKSATSTLAAQLAVQPDVFITTPKEPNFFSDDDIYAKGMDWYEGLFANAAPGQIKGEASTHYTKWPTHPQAPERVKEVTPDAKFVYIIRHPLDRAISHYRHEWTQGVTEGSPDAAARSLPEIWQYGLYHRQLMEWFEHFDPSQFLVITSEALRIDPEVTFQRVLSFIGADGGWRYDVANANESAVRVKRLPLHEIIYDNPVARTLRRTLVPRSIRERIRDARRPAMDAHFTDEALGYMGERIAPDLLALGRLCSISLPLTLSNYKDMAVSERFEIDAAQARADLSAHRLKAAEDEVGRDAALS